MIPEAEAAARSLHVGVQPVAFREARDFDTAFAAMATERADALVVLPDAIIFVHRRQLADLATPRGGAGAHAGRCDRRGELFHARVHPAKLDDQVPPFDIPVIDEPAPECFV